MSKMAKSFWSGGSQAVRLPKEFRMDGEVDRGAHGLRHASSSSGEDHSLRISEKPFR